MVYCIDTHTFVWAVKKQANIEDSYRLEQAKNFLQWVKDGKHELVIPTIVLAEALIKEPEETHNKLLEIAYRNYIVADFDGRAALKYGQMLRLENWDTAKEKAKENGIRREKMKLDHAIVSCALVHRASAIFSEDRDVIAMAKGRINVMSIADIPRQLEITDKF